MSDDIGTVCFDKFLRVGLAGSELQPTGCELRFRKSIGAFDLERTHNISRPFDYMEGDSQVAIFVCSRKK